VRPSVGATAGNRENVCAVQVAAVGRPAGHAPKARAGSTSAESAAGAAGMSEYGASINLPEWDGRPRSVEDVWTLHKGTRVAVCTLWTHPKGGEIRLIGLWRAGSLTSRKPCRQSYGITNAPEHAARISGVTV